MPSEWQIKPLGELATISSGGTPRRDRAEYWDGSVPWVTTTEIDFGQITKASQFISQEGLANSAAKLLPVGTLLLALYGQGKTRGKVGVLGMPAATNQACASITVGDGVDAGYLLHFLASRYEAIRALSNGGSQDNLNGSIVKGILVPCPTLGEQLTIAAALSDVDALLAKLDQLIAKKRDFKRAAMQQLLTGQTRLPGFSGEWMVRRLGDLGEFLKGRGVTRDQSQGGPLPCLRYGEIYTTHQDVIRAFTSWISAQVAATATKLKRGDILFAGSGETKEEIGKCVAFIDDIEAFAGGDIVILRPRQASSLFLGYALNAPAVNRQKASRGQGDAVVHVSAAALAHVVVAIPEVAEQTAIATLLSDIDAELTALTARRDKTRALKQGMAQALLTGRIRLV